MEHLIKLLIGLPAAEPQKSDEELLQELSSVVQQLKEREV